MVKIGIKFSSKGTKRHMEINISVRTPERRKHELEGMALQTTSPSEQTEACWDFILLMLQRSPEHIMQTHTLYRDLRIQTWSQEKESWEEYCWGGTHAELLLMMWSTEAAHLLVSLVEHMKLIKVKESIGLIWLKSSHCHLYKFFDLLGIADDYYDCLWAMHVFYMASPAPFHSHVMSTFYETCHLF